MERKPKVLYVDDHEDYLDVITMLLDREAIEAHGVREANLAFELAQHEDFDLYILDTWLPDVDGIELCRNLRTLNPNKPVLFYSGVTLSEVQEAALSVGAAGYVLKPDFDELFRKVTYLIRSPPFVTAV